jgi:hypothetical protein
MRVSNSSTDDGISIATAAILSKGVPRTMLISLHAKGSVVFDRMDLQRGGNFPGEGLLPCSPGFRLNLPPILHERGFKVGVHN